MIEVVGHADGEGETGVGGGRYVAFDRPVGLRRSVGAVAGEVLEVEQRGGAELPGAILIEVDRRARAIGGEQLDVGGIEPEVAR
jgi:hypothetical protein